MWILSLTKHASNFVFFHKFDRSLGFIFTIHFLQSGLYVLKWTSTTSFDVLKTAAMPCDVPTALGCDHAAIRRRLR